MTDASYLDWVYRYAKFGWPVLPLHNLLPQPTDLDKEIESLEPAGRHNEKTFSCSCPKGPDCPPRNQGKHPRVTRWEERASTDPRQIRAWWMTWPQANIGVACGKAGFLVLDLDSYKNDFVGAELTEPERQTITCLTGGGGEHLWYRMRPEDTFGNSSEGLPPGIDIRAHGGMVVVPPSLHPSGHRYRWKTGYGPGEIAPLPIPDSLRRILERQGSDKADNKKGYTGRVYSPAELEEAMTNAGWTFIPKKTLDKLGRISYDLAACPLNSEGHDGAAVLLFMQGPDKGKPCFICQHTRHKDKGWRDVKLLLFPPGGFHLTDLGNARRLAAKYKGKIRYVIEWKKWIFWTGLHWEIDRSGEINRLGRTIPGDIQAEANKVSDRGLSEKLYKWALSSESMYRLESAVRLAHEEEGVPIWQDDLENNPWLFNVANGVLDLRLGQAVEPQPEEMLVKRSNIEFDPEAACPRWLTFLQEITNGNEALSAFLQRAVGYSLTGSTGEQVWFFLYGNGRNGKSTFTNILAELAGGYYLKLPSEAFLQRRGLGSERIPNDIAQMPGRRLVIAAEVDRNRKLSEALIKDITGGDAISARFMRGEWFTFRPVCKLWMYGNHKPLIGGVDEGIWRRVRLVPFTAMIPEENIDRQLGHKLRAELPGILNWALAGCRMWLKDGLGLPSAIRDATAEYRSEMDTLGDFLESCFDLAPAGEPPVGETPAKEIYAVYRTWCMDNGYRAMSQRGLGLALRSRGFEKKRSRSGVIWLGLVLNDQGVELLTGQKHGRYPVR